MHEYIIFINLLNRLHDIIALIVIKAAPADSLFILLQDSPEGAARQAGSSSTEKQYIKTSLVTRRKTSP